MVTVDCAWCGANVEYATLGSCPQCGRNFCDMCLMAFHICDDKPARLTFYPEPSTTGPCPEWVNT